jgi:hypothetical protein
MNVFGPGNSFVDTTTSATSGNISINATTGGMVYAYSDGSTEESENPYAGSSRTHVIRKIKKKKGSKKGTQDPKTRIRTGPLVIFRFLKKKFTVLEADRLYRRLEQISKVMESVSRSQIALVEELETKALRVMREATMASCGFNKFIEGDTLNNFVDACKNRVIKITKMKNYARFIPNKAQDRLDKAEKKGLFDGYVVVHTDPNDTSVKKTVEEKKDPILFGVIAESERFYFIADWKDKLCDLTLDMIIDKLGLDKVDYKMDNNFGKVFSEALELDADS